jgi:methyl-accepting chemotaxis protein
MRLLRRSIRAKLVLPIVGLVTVGFAVTTLIAVTRATSEASTTARQQIDGAARDSAARFNGEVSRYRAIVSTLSTVLASYHGSDRVALNGMLHQVAVDNPDVLGIYWQSEPNMGPGPDSAFRGNSAAGSGPKGMFVPYWNRNGGKLESTITEPTNDAEWYALPKRTKRFQVIEPYVYDGVLLASYVDPILRNGRFIGASGADSSLASIDAAVRKVRVLHSGYAFMVTRAGTFISAPDNKVVGKKTLAWLARHRHDKALARLAAAAQAGKSATVTTRDPFTGKESVLYAEPVAQSGWSVIVSAPKAEMMAGANRLQWTLIGIAAGILTLIGAAVWLIARRLMQPLDTMAEAAGRIAIGDVDVEVETRSEDEIGRMAAAFREMVAYLRSMVGAAERVAAGDLTVEVAPRSEQDALGRSVRAMVGSLQETLGEVREAADTVSDASQQMAASAEETGHAVGEIATAVSDVAVGAERQVVMLEQARQDTAETGDAATAAREIATTGVAAAEQASSAMEAVRSSTAEVSSAMETLKERSDRIAGIVETITGISKQTNLLALNAAIEAARAGEHGRGFSVVAEEVRGLADESAAAAGTIGELVAEMEAETERTREVVDKSAAESLQSAEIVGQATEAFRSIEASVSEIAARIERVVDQAAEVAAVAEESSASTEEVSASTQQTSATAQEIAASAQQLAATSERLTALVGRFRTS